MPTSFALHAASRRGNPLTQRLACFGPRSTGSYACSKLNHGSQNTWTPHNSLLLLRVRTPSLDHLRWGTPESPPPPASPTPLPSTLPNPPPPPPKLAPLLLPPPPNANAPPPLLLPPPPNANAPPPAGAALNVVDEVGAPKAKPALALAELPLNPPKAGAAAAAPPKALPPPNALLPLLAPKAGAGVAPKPAAPKAGVGVAPNTLLPLLAPKAGAGVAPKPAKAGVGVALKPPTAGGAAGCATAVSSPSIIPSAELFTAGCCVTKHSRF